MFQRRYWLLIAVVFASITTGVLIPSAGQPFAD